VHVVEDVWQVKELFPAMAVAVYKVIEEPPLLLGADQLTTNELFALCTETLVGAAGELEGLTFPNVTGDESPAALVANTVIW
jgi:hypothetical protein